MGGMPCREVATTRFGCGNWIGNWRRKRQPTGTRELGLIWKSSLPYAGPLPQGHQPTEEEITLALTRRGKPTWAEKDLEQVLYTLGCAGYGWLRPEGVRRELERMARDWKGRPPLLGL